MTSTKTGATLGGAASARASRETRELESRRLDIVESQFKAQQDADMLQSVRDRLAGLAEQATGLVSNIQIPRDDPRFEQAIAPIRSAVATLSARAQERFPGALDAQSQLSIFDSTVASTPTIVEAAATEARGEVAAARETAGAEGLSQDVRVLLGLATPLTPTDTRKLQMERDRLEAAGDMRAAQEITAQIVKRGTITGTTEFDPGKPEEFATALVTPTTEDVERLRTNIRENSASYQTAANTLSAVQEAGGLATGFVGASVETISGIVGNLGALGQEMNAAFEDATGADLSKITGARTRMREGVSSALQEITNEEGSRYTDTEREIAAEVLRGLTPSSNIDQVVSAYQEFFRIINASDIRNTQEIARGAKINLSDEGGVEQMVSILRNMGMGDARIVEILAEVSFDRAGP